MNRDEVLCYLPGVVSRLRHRSELEETAHVTTSAHPPVRWTPWEHSDASFVMDLLVLGGSIAELTSG